MRRVIFECMQSRAEVVPLKKGDSTIFAVNYRPHKELWRAITTRLPKRSASSYMPTTASHSGPVGSAGSTANQFHRSFLRIGHRFHEVASCRSNARLRSTPQRYPESDPSLRTTR